MMPTPLFILGVTPRSGTNYLREILTLHPDCARSKHIGEDFLIHSLSHLDRFVDTVASHWNSAWGNDPRALRSSLVQGLTSYLTPAGCTSKYVVTKTPSCTNASRCLEVFQDARFIVLLRRGQDVVESFTKTFDSTFSYAARLWARGASEILRLIDDPAVYSSGRLLIVRYEDLYEHNATTMTTILSFLGLDAGRFDFKQSQECAVIGSSTHRGGSTRVSWAPLAKDTNFDPLRRSADWSRWKHYRFNWLAGKVSCQAGYPIHFDASGPLYIGYNLLHSLRELMIRSLHSVIRTIRIFHRRLPKDVSLANKEALQED